MLSLLFLVLFAHISTSHAEWCLTNNWCIGQRPPSYFSIFLKYSSWIIETIYNSWYNLLYHNTVNTLIAITSIISILACIYLIRGRHRTLKTTSRAIRGEQLSIAKHIRYRPLKVHTRVARKSGNSNQSNRLNQRTQQANQRIHRQKRHRCLVY